MAAERRGFAPRPFYAPPQLHARPLLVPRQLLPQPLMPPQPLRFVPQLPAQPLQYVVPAHAAQHCLTCFDQVESGAKAMDDA